jgi:hypothetical protein
MAHLFVAVLCLDNHIVSNGAPPAQVLSVPAHAPESSIARSWQIRGLSEASRRTRIVEPLGGSATVQSSGKVSAERREGKGQIPLVRIIAPRTLGCSADSPVAARRASTNSSILSVTRIRPDSKACTAIGRSFGPMASRLAPAEVLCPLRSDRLGTPKAGRPLCASCAGTFLCTDRVRQQDVQSDGRRSRLVSETARSARP